MVSRSTAIVNPLLAGSDKPQNWYRLQPPEMSGETCQGCERPRREFDEGVQKTFWLEDRLRHAKDRQDNEQGGDFNRTAGYIGRLADTIEPSARISSRGQ